MNTEFFIARRLILDKENEKSVSRSILRIAVFGIALSLTVMIIAMAVVTGFKNEITDKVAGFGSHIQILNFDSNLSFETQPINKNQEFLPELKENPEIVNIQAFGIKAGIIKTKTEIQGVVVKGIGSDYDWSFLSQYIVEGEPFYISDSSRSNEILISNFMARFLKLNVDDEFIMYFVQDPPRMRRFKISGIYETSLEEFDKTFVFADLAHIQKLNDWGDELISGYEINIRDFSNLEWMTYEVMNTVGFGFEEDGSRLKVTNIKDKYPQIFDWLNLQDMNVLIVLLLMLIVAGFNMVSGLLILILDRTRMIGVLKALGAINVGVRKIFMYQAAFLILKGLFWGNIIGLSLCLLQDKFGFIKLDQSSYYLTEVPVHFSLVQILGLNMGTCLIIMLVLILPSMLISRISPAKAIRFQ